MVIRDRSAPKENEIIERGVFALREVLGHCEESRTERIDRDREAVCAVLEILRPESRGDIPLARRASC
jgi:hypothetical protein